MEDMQFDLNLIEAVKRHPEIYDHSHVDYRHFGKKRQETWKKIAESLAVPGMYAISNRETWLDEEAGPSASSTACQVSHVAEDVDICATALNGNATITIQTKLPIPMVISDESQVATASATESQAKASDAQQLNMLRSTLDSDNADGPSDEDDEFGRFVSGMLKKLGEEEKRRAKAQIATYLQNMQTNKKSSLQ
uniref:BESS domain-containing protein n=1 Tax=Glossina palpalis gambiensis TaxID=67801 RepID=A0A1B0B486_9MUSC